MPRPLNTLTSGIVRFYRRTANLWTNLKVKFEASGCRVVTGTHESELRNQIDAMETELVELKLRSQVSEEAFQRQGALLRAQRIRCGSLETHLNIDQYIFPVQTCWHAFRP